MGVIDLLLSRATARRIPVAGTFELTARCNLSCKMCYIHQLGPDGCRREKERSAQWWIDLAKEAQQAGTLTLLLTGGEPTLRPDFLEIYNACTQMGFVVTVNTNGTLLSEEIFAAFGKHPPFRVNITLYGTSARTYERLCGNGAAYDRVIKNIHRLRDMGIHLRLNFTATHLNRADIPSAHAFAREHGLPLHLVTYTFPPVRREDGSAPEVPRFTPEEAAQTAVESVCAATAPEDLCQRCRELIREPVPRADDCDTDPSVRCRAGKGSYWVTYEGNLLPCGMTPTVQTPLDGQPFLTAWQRIVEDFARVQMPLECVSCPEYENCEVCPAVCHGENGRFDMVPRYICDKNRQYRELLKKISQGDEP